jgi:Tn3 transposase DDE domain
VRSLPNLQCRRLVVGAEVPDVPARAGVDRAFGGAEALFDYAVGWPRKHRVLLPGVSVLARQVSEAQAKVPIVAHWGNRLLASVDGLRFVVPVRSISTAPNPKYFGFKRGITWLNAVNDHVFGIGQMVVPGTPRDSLHILDALLRFWRAEMDGIETGGYGPLTDLARTNKGEPEESDHPVGGHAESGRLHLLQVVDPVDDTYRRQVGKQLSVQESRHTLARDICHGKRGTIHQAYRDGMED